MSSKLLYHVQKNDLSVGAQGNLCPHYRVTQEPPMQK